MNDLFASHLTQLAETGICLSVFLLLRFSSRTLVRNAVIRSSFKAKEEREILRLFGLLNLTLLGVVLTAIWAVKQSEVLIFATSVITVLGVALFAEMSILSNITACLVLFFQHPVKIGDTVALRDGDHALEGELTDITYFFTYIRTAEGKLVTIPNSVLLKGPFTIVQSKER